VNRTRAATLLLILLLGGVAVGGVIGIMQVRLRADEVGQRIRSLERQIAERRKEAELLDRRRAQAQDALDLARRVGDDLRAPEPSQVVWVRPPLAGVRPLGSAGGAITPRMAALNAAGGDPSGQGGPLRR
jgi:hypothetical protein